VERLYPMDRCGEIVPIGLLWRDCTHWTAVERLCPMECCGEIVPIGLLWRDCTHWTAVQRLYLLDCCPLSQRDNCKMQPRLRAFLIPLDYVIMNPQFCKEKNCKNNTYKHKTERINMVYWRENCSL
jgi:hypothetical protein